MTHFLEHSQIPTFQHSPVEIAPASHFTGQAMFQCSKTTTHYPEEP